MTGGFSRLELRPAERPGGGGKTRRDFLDFVVDGRSLFDELTRRGHDLVSCLGWGDPAWRAEGAARLLRRVEPDLPGGRTALFVCPECGDLDCGAVSAVVAREGEAIVWRDLAFEHAYMAEGGRGVEPLPGLGPFRFHPAEYHAALAPLADARAGR
jgi:hypothetical protein